MEERCRLRVPENCCDLSLSKSTSRLRELLVDWSIFSRSVAYSTCGEGGREELKLEEGSSGSVNRLQVYHCVCVSARARACVCVCVCATMTDIEEVAQHILSQAKMDTHILACIHKSYT